MFYNFCLKLKWSLFYRSGDGTARLWDITDREFHDPPLILSHYEKKTGSEVSRNKDVTAIDWKVCFFFFVIFFYFE